MEEATNGALGEVMATNGLELKQQAGGPKKADSGDWLADIFNAMDEGTITSLEISDMALPAETIAALEAEAKAEAAAEAEADEGKTSETWGGDAEGPAGGGKRGRGECGEEMAKHKKSKREKLRREALNDRFMDLSSLLDPSKPPKTDKATIVTEAAMVISHLRKELATLSATLKTLHKNNEALEKEKSGLFADKSALLQDKAALQQDKHKLQSQLHCFMRSMPFASPVPGMAYSVPPPFPQGTHGAPPQQQQQMVMAPGANPEMKLASHNQAGGMMPLMWSFPPLVVQTTTAEEDAKLRAPVA